MVLLECVHRVGRELYGGHAKFIALFLDDVLRDEGDVLGMGAQGGHFDFDDAKALVEVLPEFAFGYGLLQVAIGGGYDADVNGYWGGAAQAGDFFGVEDAQEAHLCREGHFADFIEEDGAAVGGFKDARSLRACVGKRTFFVAEEFAFEEGFGDCAAVDDEKGLVAARALPVDGFGDEVFPGAAFARDEDADGGGRDLGHAFADLLHGV